MDCVLDSTKLHVNKEEKRLAAQDETEAKLHDRNLAHTRSIRLNVGVALAFTVTFLLCCLLPSYHTPSFAASSAVKCGNTTLQEIGWTLQALDSDRHISQAGLRMLDSQKQMSLACADLWISRGEICETIKQGQVKLEEASISAVWSYSDPSSSHCKAWQAYSEISLDLPKSNKQSIKQ